MCSDRGRQRLLAAAALAALLAACGNKEPPEPPPLKIPAPTQDLAIQQRGNDILLTLSYPTVTVAGLAIEDLQGVEFWTLERPLPALEPEPAAEDGKAEEDGEEGAEDAASEPGTGEATEAAEPQEAGAETEETAEEGAQPAGDAAEDDEEEAAGEDAAAAPAAPPIPLRPEDRVQVELLEFAVTARLELTLRGAELEAATVGDKIIARFPGEEPGEDEEIAHLFATRVLAGKRLASNWSNLVKLVRRPPPPPPTALAVEATGDGVVLTWESDFEEALGFRIYRRDARSRGYSEALRQVPPTLLTYVDRTAAYGNRYIYSVTAVAGVNPLIESALAGEHEVDYQDRFAPAAPRDLVALAQRGSVRLLWDASPGDDVLGYFVHRRGPGAETVTLNQEPVRRLEFTDTTVAAGAVYFYSVSAVDQIGNRGKASEETEARVP